ncbi:translation initiation factor IF-2 subunit gamma [Candidatus Pacearchaeota archaeon]|nr:translation initiation factor IF-2 subunit gamma [Candidatus Pacearchaeota archaeon]
MDIPEINVGIVGHIDHGKTTFLSKLTGKFTDTHSEELKRGITIKLGYTEMTIYKCSDGFSNKNSGKDCAPYRYVSFIDAPGHEMLMATMLSGAAIIDAAILIVAANEGIKPQTKEHFMALQAKKVKNIIIVQNKIDLVSKEKAIESYKEIKNFMKDTFAENSPIIPVSTLQEININKVIEELAKVPISKKEENSIPIFLVARSFDINLPGTRIENLKGGILGGILKKGKLKVGDEIEIKPGLSMKKANQEIYQTLTTKILSLQKGNKQISEAMPGSSISIETSLDPFLTKADHLTGCLVSLKNSLPEISYKIKLKPEIFNQVTGTSEEQKTAEIKNTEMLMLSVNTTITVGIVEKINKKTGEIELSLKIPVVPLEGDNVGIARNFQGHWRLIGWGEVIGETKINNK